MTELERRALLGDKEAQKECTEKGIMLPCPSCAGSFIELHNSIESWYECKCGFAGPLKVGPTAALKAWNTRPEPPIGRCGECNHRYENELNEYVCEILDISSDDNFYCSYFEPKESEENE